jgi:tetratricopeptide (TPR) repeat protein
MKRLIISLFAVLMLFAGVASANQAEDLYAEGVLLYNRGDYKAALQKFDGAAAVLPTGAPGYGLYSMRSLTYSHLGQYDDAIRDADLSISRLARNANGYYARAVAYKGKQMLDKALADIDQTLLFDPKAVSAYNLKGNIFIERQQYEEAQAVAGKMIALSGESWQAYGLRGTSHFYLQKYDLAITDCLKTLQLRPQHVYAHFFLGESYEKLNQKDNAAVSYYRFLAAADKNDPNVALVQRRLAAMGK